MDDGAGSIAVRYARAYATAAASGARGKVPPGTLPDPPAEFGEPMGVFVTLKKFPSGDLRGCIGYPEPVMPFGEALVRAAASAAVDDYRFRPVTLEEMDSITVEVTALSVPRAFDVLPEDLPSAVDVGRHGLIISLGGARGLLLPQVPVEWGWDAIEYLENLSMKAGLHRNAWKDPDTQLSWFTGEVFSETEPYGETERS